MISKNFVFKIGIEVLYDLIYLQHIPHKCSLKILVCNVRPIVQTTNPILAKLAPNMYLHVFYMYVTCIFAWVYMHSKNCFEKL